MLGLSPVWMGLTWASPLLASPAGNGLTAGKPGLEQAAPSPEWTPTSTDRAQPASSEAYLPLLRNGADPVEIAVRSRIQYLEPEESHQGIKSAREVMEEGDCQTCKERKYQDGSDDPGVSYQTPTHIAPEQAASAVRGHEQEHVVREQAEAQREGREVVSQTVTLHTDICPECGRVYISGGTTRTTTRADSAAQLYQQQEKQPSLFQAVA